MACQGPSVSACMPSPSVTVCCHLQETVMRFPDSLPPFWLASSAPSQVLAAPRAATSLGMTPSATSYLLTQLVKNPTCNIPLGSALAIRPRSGLLERTGSAIAPSLIKQNLDEEASERAEVGQTMMPTRCTKWVHWEVGGWSAICSGTLSFPHAWDFQNDLLLILGSCLSRQQAPCNKVCVGRAAEFQTTSCFAGRSS
jgi:hypothetical protein